MRKGCPKQAPAMHINGCLRPATGLKSAVLPLAFTRNPSLSHIISSKNHNSIPPTRCAHKTPPLVNGALARASPPALSQKILFRRQKMPRAELAAFFVGLQAEQNPENIPKKNRTIKKARKHLPSDVSGRGHCASGPPASDAGMTTTSPNVWLSVLIYIMPPYSSAMFLMLLIPKP